MHSSGMRFLSLFLCFAAAAGSPNLLTYVDESVGNVLGTAFGAQALMRRSTMLSSAVVRQV